MRRLLALVALACISVILAPSASGPPNLLAPEGICAPNGRQEAACLIQYARTKAKTPQLRSSPVLRLAAGIKAEKIISCNQFTHTPCGQPANRPVVAVGYQPVAWAENLYLGAGPYRAPREAVRAWLLSWPHRVNILNGRYDEFGLVVRHASVLGGDADVAVWVLELGRR
jgi:uncharacterized protein YkwD